MARSSDKEVVPPEQSRVDDGRAGRVEMDSRGHNVWRWAKAALDSTSILLKRLENKELALEPTQKVPVVPGADARSAAKPKPGAKPAGPPKGDGNAADARSSAKGAKRTDPVRAQVRRDGGGGFDPYNTR